MYLPKLSFKKFFNYTLNAPPSTLTQQGFAVIPLIVLTLLGITASTILVQNGVNFLPKAQVELIDCTVTATRQPPPTRADWDQLLKCPGQNIQVNHIQVLSTNENLTVEEFEKRRSSIRAGDTRVWCHLQPQCPTQPSTSYCVLQGIKNPSDPENDIRIREKEIWEGCDTQKNRVKYTCQSQNQLSVEILQRSSPECGAAPAAPAAQSAAASTELANWNPPNDNAYRIKYASGCFTHATGQSVRQWVVKKGNTLVESSQGACDGPNRPCDGLSGWCGAAGQQCIRDDNFQAHCGSPTSQSGAGTAPTVQAQKCDAAQCKSPNKGCYVIEGKNRCVYEKVTCTQAETDFCKTPPDPRQGCEVKDATIEGQKIQYTQCAAAKPGAGAPSNTAARPAAPATTNTGTTTTPRQGTTQNTTATAPRPGPEAPRTAPNQTNVANTSRPQADLSCGKDEKGVDIPCYAIGVFSPNELTQREAQATLASVNYAKFRSIIDEQESKIGAEIANKAREKIAAAEKEVKACLEKK